MSDKVILRMTLDDIIGSWRLVRAVQVFDDGTEVDEFGQQADGYLCYTAQGTVSAVLGSTARADLVARDPQSGTPDEYAEAARRFIAYAGRFTLDSELGNVTHHIDVSLYPNWQNEDQPRRLLIDQGQLAITASDRVTADGRTFHVELHWRRPA